MLEWPHAVGGYHMKKKQQPQFNQNKIYLNKNSSRERQNKEKKESIIKSGREKEGEKRNKRDQRHFYLCSKAKKEHAT